MEQITGWKALSDWDKELFAIQYKVIASIVITDFFSVRTLIRAITTRTN